MLNDFHYFRLLARKTHQSARHCARVEGHTGQTLQWMHQTSQNYSVFEVNLPTNGQSFRYILCPKCNGIGGAENAVSKCQNCGGRGVEIFNQQIGPGMIQRIQRACSQCSGEGEVNKDPCKNCKGKKRVI